MKNTIVLSLVIACFLVAGLALQGMGQESPAIKQDAENLAKLLKANFKKLGGGKTKTVGGIDFVFVPGGSYIMGSPETKFISEERPRHKVTLSSFWMGKYEVTQKQYQDVMGANPSYYKGEDLPVDTVSWNDAAMFCEKFNKKYNATLRLPTEAEWEFAARAGTTGKYHWGAAIDGKYVWYDKNSNNTTNPVGKKLPNPWGLYDMFGNVWEFCADWHDDNYYASSPEKDPKGPASGSERVIRGASWYDNVNYISASFRYRDAPAKSYYYYGFRVVMPGE